MLTIKYYAQTSNANAQRVKKSLSPLVLLHGWGSNSGIWQPIMTSLQAWFDIITVDMSYQNETAESLCLQLSEQLPQQYHLCGWSLGGMLATQLAAQQPQAVLSLLTLASNMQFVASDTWPDAMDAKTYNRFYESVQDDVSRMLKRFMSLIVKNDQHLHEQLILLRKKISPSVEVSDLLQGLHILSSMNNAVLLPTIHCPARHVFGEVDSLVPIAAAEKISALNSDHQIMKLYSRAHLLHFPEEEFIHIANSFYTKYI